MTAPLESALRAPIEERSMSNDHRAEDALCERTMHRLRQHAEAMGITIDEAMRDVIPDTRKRLVAYLARREGQIDLFEQAAP